MNFNPILLSIKIKPDIILDMVKVETEPFFIGGENGSFDGMKRVVNIEKDFYISKFEITQKQWAAIMQSPAPTKYPGPNRPLDEVSLEDAMNFCNKISQITGLTFTLPTEAQLEKSEYAVTANELKNKSDIPIRLFLPYIGYQ